MRLVKRQQMRELDRATIEQYGTPGLVLMERAGRGLTAILHREVEKRAGRRVLIVCGKGNNGGDGYVVARELRQRGADVSVFSVAPTSGLRGDARRNLERYQALGGVVHVLDVSRGDGGDAGGAGGAGGDGGRGDSGRGSSVVWERLRTEAASADILVDAILGTGFQGEVRGELVDVIEIMNSSTAFTVAVDVPSGLDADSGDVSDTCVLADLTVCFGCAKLGCYVEPGRGHAGRVEVVDIGIAYEALEAVDATHELVDAAAGSLLVPFRHPLDHKGDCGRVLVIGGSVGMSGAVSMAGRAALMTGSGLVTVAAPESLNEVLETQL
ncbi:MAG: bifunctional ADP-dependent NAD(P)H-hydrate dehydratase/NAD(P)H-hydrate epimerase, partial [Candidatus Eiseniibacteriota bacterium]